MTRFKVNGEYIDIKPQDFAFTKKNILFAFDNMECERTTTINIPGSTKNNRIFGLAGNPGFYGDAMRKRYAAYFEDGIISQSGHLYLTRYNPSVNEYEAIFVADLGFKDIKDSGKLLDLFDASDFSETAVYNNVPESTHKVFGTYSFELATEFANEMYPSVSLKTILERGLNKMGYSYVLPAGIDEAYITPVNALNSSGDNAEIGQTLRAYDNLPDCTLVDLIKIAGYVTGTLPYIEDGILRFENNQYESWSRKINIHNIREINSVERRFSDWARNNRILAPARKSGKNISVFVKTVDDDGFGDYNNIIEPNAAVIYAAHPSKYLIDNDNVDYSNVLVEMPFTGISGSLTRREAPLLRLRSGSSLLPYGNTTAFGRTYSLPANPLIERLCSESTAIECKAIATLIEYQTLTPRSLVCVNSVRYVWTEAQWSNENITLKLSKI